MPDILTNENQSIVQERDDGASSFTIEQRTLGLGFRPSYFPLHYWPSSPQPASALPFREGTAELPSFLRRFHVQFEGIQGRSRSVSDASRLASYNCESPLEWFVFWWIYGQAIASGFWEQKQSLGCQTMNANAQNTKYSGVVGRRRRLVPKTALPARLFFCSLCCHSLFREMRPTYD